MAANATQFVNWRHNNFARAILRRFFLVAVWIPTDLSWHVHVTHHMASLQVIPKHVKHQRAKTQSLRDVISLLSVAFRGIIGYSSLEVVVRPLSLFAVPGIKPP